MPKWLQGMAAPTFMLWLYAMAAVLIFHEGSREYSGRADYLSSIALAFVLAIWVNADAQKRNQRLCYDYNSFVFFAWPIVVPIYLFKTRGIRAFLTILSFAAIWLIALALVAAGIWVAAQVSSRD